MANVTKNTDQKRKNSSSREAGNFNSNNNQDGKKNTQKATQTAPLNQTDDEATDANDIELENSDLEITDESDNESHNGLNDDSDDESEDNNESQKNNRKAS